MWGNHYAVIIMMPLAAEGAGPLCGCWLLQQGEGVEGLAEGADLSRHLCCCNEIQAGVV